MNIRPRMVNNSRNRNRKQQHSSWSRAGKVFMLLFLMITAFVVINTRVSLSQKMSEIKNDSTNITKRIHAVERNIEMLRSQKEELSSYSYICKRIADYKLPLAMPRPDQTMQLVMLASPTASHTDQIISSKPNQAYAANNERARYRTNN